MIGDIFYNLFITPLVFIFEIIFWFFREYEHTALAIVAISLVMNFLALPLYKRADEINEKERQKVASMSDRVSRIKRSFKGDERYMVLTAYYREQHYKPIYSLRSTFSLLLQVPFFIAAYNYLSTPGLMDGVSFLFLEDLGSPDALIKIGQISINVMPVIMTLINVVSSYIYLRGTSLREKIQTYGLAVIFLVLLYNSPSGLVFYWTLNQVFSVLKNVFMKLVKGRRSLNIFFSAMGVCIAVALLCAGFYDSAKKVFFIAVVFIICQIPSIITIAKKYLKLDKKVFRQIGVRYFILGGVFLSIFVGLVIPMSVIGSSPAEFSTGATDPVVLLVNNLCICTGIFIIWLGVFYYMSDTVVRNIFTYAILALSGISVVDFMVFSKNLGLMSTYLVFESMPTFTSSEKLLNILVVLATAAVFILLLKYIKKAVQFIYIILIIGSAALFVINAAGAASAVNGSAGSISGNVAVSSEHEKILPLSKEGKNVVIIMLDRAIGSYLPYIFNEKPEIEKQFAGFTYYRNTISFGEHTNFASPALFGGYEYTPANMNARSDLSLKEKHDQALTILPILFSREGYKITFCDPPYAGYDENSTDLSIFDGIDNISTRITYGAYSTDLLEKFSTVINDIQKRNIFFYSLFRIVPTCIQNTVYNGGNYYNTASSGLACSDAFIYSYSVLYNLINLTDIEDSDDNTLFIIDNETTHSPTILQTPEYEPAANVTSDTFGNQERFELDGRTMIVDTQRKMGHYHVNMAAYIKIGNWLDYLREQGVYDNTRIIICSDHGSYLNQFSDLLVSDEFDAEGVNCLLLFKDFNSNEFVVSDEFMTNADVPVLAAEGLVTDMTNPYTGNVITSDVVKEDQLVTSSHKWSITTNHGNTFDTSDGHWWKLNGNLYDPDCWEKVQ